MAYVSVTSCTKWVTADSTVMSVDQAETEHPLLTAEDSSAAAAVSLSWFLAAMTTLYPFLAKSSAVALPTPCATKKCNQTAIVTV